MIELRGRPSAAPQAGSSIGRATAIPATANRPAVARSAAGKPSSGQPSSGQGFEPPGTPRPHVRPERLPPAPARHRLVTDLEAALDARDQLRLVFQPRLHLTTGRVVAVEALLRWQHPSLGAVAPDAYIPLVEADPLIGRLTDWVLDQAMGFAARLGEAGHRVRVSANVAPANLVIGYLVGRLVELLRRHDLPAPMLELEFTEGALIGDDSRTRSQLKQIRQIGIGVAIDDFGAGYSNLAYLKQIPADIIKIDRSLVQPVLVEPDSATIVKWLIGLGHELGLRIVAEGLETAAMQQALAGMGCDEGQGYFIARPLEADALLDWLAARRIR